MLVILPSNSGSSLARMKSVSESLELLIQWGQVYSAQALVGAGLGRAGLEDDGARMRETGLVVLKQEELDEKRGREGGPKSEGGKKQAMLRWQRLAREREKGKSRRSIWHFFLIQRRPRNKAVARKPKKY